MASKGPTITKQAASVTMDITLTIPETLEIIRNPGNATSQRVITAEQILDC
jgi:hypothetical protein